VKLFIAREKKIVGMAMLRWHWLSGGKVGTVEDVIVSSAFQRHGYGSELMRAIIKFAKKENFAYIDLTSHPDRAAANKFYQKFGWKKRVTNSYRLSL
jgi:ribosomal protein S18 acetylase RimI-like enzyme